MRITINGNTEEDARTGALEIDLLRFPSTHKVSMCPNCIAEIHLAIPQIKSLPVLQ